MALFFWMNTGNYPAGPNLWNGNPLAVAPAGTYFTPATKLDAETLNSILGTIAANLPNLQVVSQTITETSGPTTITVPANCNLLDLDGCGGGGGGGSGAGGLVYAATPVCALGGGGGARAPGRCILLPVTPGAQYDVYIGAGGTGGVGVAGSTSTSICTAGNHGLVGQPTYVTAHGSMTVLALFQGGAAGCGGSASVFGGSSGDNAVAPGGDGLAGNTLVLAAYLAGSNTAFPVTLLSTSAGGPSVTPSGVATSYNGAGSEFFPGGALAAAGSNGTGLGGAGGGGGGGGATRRAARAARAGTTMTRA